MCNLIKIGILLMSYHHQNSKFIFTHDVERDRLFVSDNMKKNANGNTNGHTNSITFSIINLIILEYPIRVHDI